MTYKLKFNKNFIYLLENDKTLLKSKSSGLLFHFNFCVQDKKNETILKYKYHTFLSYHNVKINDQKTKEQIELIKNPTHFYTLRAGSKKYTIKDTKGFLKNNIANIFLEDVQIGHITYEYLKSPWEIKLIFNNDFEPDIYILILSMIKFSHFNSES